MAWEVLIIPLIALGVWILGAVFKTEEEPAAPARRGEGKPRRAPSDLEQFLEEARRRREQQQQQSAAPPPPPPRPAEPARVERPPLSEPREKPRRLDRAPRAESARSAPRELKGPVAAPVATPVAGPVAAPLAEPPAPVRPTNIKPETQPTPRVSANRPDSPVIAQVTALLRSPRSAAAAFVLNEIMGPPLSKRRPRG